jgi:hypothetical protein
MPSRPVIPHRFLLLLSLTSMPVLATAPPGTAILPPNPFAGAVTPHPGMSGADPTTAALPRREHLQRLGIPNWHRLGQKGRGVKVAVLDSGFSGYRHQLGKALPQKVIVRSFRADGNLEAKDSQHGVLCGEVIHTLAPEAELMFANWEPSHPQKFLEAVRWAVSEGAKVITCSIIMPTWSDGEGGGAIHAELSRLLGSGVLFFACAGNTADRHWSGRFTNESRYHHWGEGIDNVLTPWGEGRVSVEMCTDQAADLELIVQDLTERKEVSRCRLHQGDHRTAVVRFNPERSHSYSVRVRAEDERTRSRFHVFVLGGALCQTRAEGSIPFPGDGAEVITVGAVETNGKRAPYSSCGPNSRELKPDLVATVPFASSFRARPFAGTSAATPQAAGIAAVVWGQHPNESANGVKQLLREAARDLGPKGHDWETGHGLLRLPTKR